MTNNNAPDSEIRKSWKLGQRWQVQSKDGTWFDLEKDEPEWFASDTYRRHPEDVDQAPLTEKQMLKIICALGDADTIRMARETGPYEVTEVTPQFVALVRAIEAAHGIAA